MGGPPTGLPSRNRSWQPRGVQSQFGLTLRFGTAAQCFGPQLSTVAKTQKRVCPRTCARHVKQIPKCNVGTKIYTHSLCDVGSDEDGSGELRCIILRAIPCTMSNYAMHAIHALYSNTIRIPYHTAPHRTTPHRTAPHYTAPHHTILPKESTSFPTPSSHPIPSHPISSHSMSHPIHPPPPCRSRLPPAGCRVPHPEVRVALGSSTPLCSCIGGVVQVVCQNPIPLASVSE